LVTHYICFQNTNYVDLKKKTIFLYNLRDAFRIFNLMGLWSVHYRIDENFCSFRFAKIERNIFKSSGNSERDSDDSSQFDIIDFYKFCDIIQRYIFIKTLILLIFISMANCDKSFLCRSDLSQL
jgi:hypothetical protein